MIHRKNPLKLALISISGVVLLAIGGCGNGSVNVDPQGGEKQKQARIAAYGKSGMPPTGKVSGGAPVQDLSGQAAARQKAQSGR